MSKKKTLLLGPLPEQTNDYSQYEETVTRWDRIIAVILVFILIIGAIVYGIMGNDEPSLAGSSDHKVTSTPHIPTADTPKNPAVTNQVSDEAKKEIVSQKRVELENERQELVSPTETGHVAKLNTPNKTEKIKNTETVQKVDSLTPEKALAEKANLINVKPTVVSIQNKAISRAVLTLEIKDKEPVSQLSNTLILPKEGIAKVILFTEMNDLRGKILYHEWYRKGVRQARVKIPVNVNKQRSHSSKYINTQMVGEWQVKVLDEASKLYVLADFNVVKP